MTEIGEYEDYDGHPDGFVKFFWRDRSMRIIDTDNFGGDYPNEKFHLFGMSKDTAEKICKLLNDENGEHSSRYYRVVPEGYELQPGFQP